MLWLMFCLLPAEGQAGICADVGNLLTPSREQLIPSSYFDEYAVTEEQGVFLVYASKTLELDFAIAVAVLDDLKSHPDFIPGYLSLRMATGPQQELLTGIRFRAAFSPFTSSFTNQVELLHETDAYRQCWRQLDMDDARNLIERKNAPRRNRGYWKIDKLSAARVRIRYFCEVEPPWPIPAWLYSRIVRGSYVELYERIIVRIQQVTNLTWIQ